jgi:hypothetical protein
MSRNAHGAPWQSSSSLPSWRGQRTPHAPGGRYACRSCKTNTEEDSNGDRPDGVYTLKIAGPYNTKDVQPGTYCSVDCLLIGVMKRYGMTEQHVRNWIAGQQP